MRPIQTPPGEWDGADFTEFTAQRKRRRPKRPAFQRFEVHRLTPVWFLNPSATRAAAAELTKHY
jgi:hypothetical protein